MPQRAALAPEGRIPAYVVLLCLPQPQDVQRGVVVPMQTRPTVRAFMPPDGQALGDQDAAA